MDSRRTHRGDEGGKVYDELTHLFSPVFLNRIDEVVYFHRLDQKHIRKIVDLMLRELNDRLSERGIELVFSPAAKRLLAEKGFDEKFGARYLRRTVQGEVEDALAMELLKGSLGGSTRIRVSVKSRSICFKPFAGPDSRPRPRQGTRGL
jgi:ATP-dependent Clp protease ATP-binding subunit ClpC